MTLRWLLWAAALVGLTITARAREVSPQDAIRAYCTPPARQPLPPVEIIVDDSESMAGFLRSEGGDVYRKVLENLIARSGQVVVRPLNSLPRESRVDAGTRRRKRSSSSGAPRASVGNPFSDTFYSKQATPLDAAFRAARDDQGNRIFVIVSDLLQPRSSPGAATRMLAAALQNKRAVLIVGFRSAFSSQVLPRCTPRCTSTALRPPVFVIVLAPTSAILREFEEQVALRANSVQTDSSPHYFYGDGPALAVGNVLPAKQRGERWSIVRQDVDCKAEFGPRQVIYVSRDAPSRFRLELSPIVRTSVIDLTEAEPDVSFVDEGSVRAAAFEPSAARLEHRVGMVYKSTGIRVAYALDQPTQGWRAYRVRYRPGDRSLSAPDWVTNWSKEEPAYNPERNVDAVNVYIVKELVQTILNSTFIEQRPMLEHFLVFQAP